jgi:hypothetical protein
MRPVIHAPTTRAALLCACLGLTTAAQASQDFTLPIGTCTPANAITLQSDLRLTNGAVRKPGRNPPGSAYFCGLPIDDLTAKPSWNRFELQYIDRNSAGDGHVTARLMRRTISSGATTTLAVASSVPSATLRTVHVDIAKTMDTSIYAYFVIVTLTSPSQPVDAYTVRLTTR